MKNIMKCKDCKYRKEVTCAWNKRKVFRCNKDKNRNGFIGYRVGENTQCYLIYKEYYEA